MNPETIVRKINVGDLVDNVTYIEGQKLLPQIQKRFKRRVKFIIVQDGRLCLVTDW